MYHFLIEFRALFEQYRPRALICVGSKQQDLFRLAFLGEAGVFIEGQRVELPSPTEGRPKVCEILTVGSSSRVILTPFLGQGGIMSDEDLIAVAELAQC
jgi:hypothetical protein